MGRTFLNYLASTRVFACRQCKTHLAIIDELISRQFNGQYGRACLFENVSNVIEGPAEDRTMTTGLHTVRDICCAKCSIVLGWKYDRAYEASQKYKEGHYILEKNLLCDVESLGKDLDALDSGLEIIQGRDPSPQSSIASL